MSKMFPILASMLVFVSIASAPAPEADATEYSSVALISATVSGSGGLQ